MLRQLRAIASRVKAQPASLRFLASRIMWLTGVSPLFVVPRPRYKLRFYPTAFSASLWMDPKSFLDDESAFAQILRPGDVVVDVGANIGTLSLCASALVGDTGRVIAIEPHPRIFKYLRKNIDYNKRRNVTCHNFAVGETERHVSFSDRRSDDQNSVTAEQNGIDVEMRTLDTILTDVDQVTLLKIDTEGYEMHVLAGATKVLQRTQAVYLELSTDNYTRFGASVPEVLALLRARGFVAYRLRTPMTLEIFDDTTTHCSCENVLAIGPDSTFAPSADTP